MPGLLLTSNATFIAINGLAGRQRGAGIRVACAGHVRPSFFTGSLIRRFGVLTVMAAGVLLMRQRRLAAA